MCFIYFLFEQFSNKSLSLFFFFSLSNCLTKLFLSCIRSLLLFFVGLSLN